MSWVHDDEMTFKEDVRSSFHKRMKKELKKGGNPLKIGKKLAAMFEEGDKAIVDMVVPRAVEKWASKRTLPKWKALLKDKQMLAEIREIGKSIANTMRPLAGNNFTLWVTILLNEYFKKSGLPLSALTRGKVKSVLSKTYIKKGKDFRPDIDIVIVRTDKNNKPVAIISTKTTLAERVMQTISWARYVKGSDKSKIKIYLVTLWESFDGGANVERVQELDGVFVCNDYFKPKGKIRRFSDIEFEFIKLGI